jgi:hypothetical protein
MGAESYNLVIELAQDLLVSGERRLRDLNFSVDENQALRRIWEVAFRRLLELEQIRMKISSGVLSEDLYRGFIRAEGTADALLDLVFEEHAPRLELLSYQFEAFILTAAPLSVHFNEAVTVLTGGLIKAILTETSKPDDPLYRRLSILRPALIHSLLKEQTGTLEEIAATLTRLENRLPAEAKYNVVFLGQSVGTVIGDNARVRQDQSLGPLLEQTLTSIKEIAAGAPLTRMVDTLVELLDGISEISADYAGRIKNFLIEYLGTPDKPVPFGGRIEQLADLNEWLTTPGAPPYCLIAAEAGRGKSALLARWADSLVRHGAARVVFIPISIRFNTAAAEVTFTALAARLSEVYGEPVKWASLTSQQWREICLKYLGLSLPGDTPLLIILDGLDEAADWRAGPDLFPLAPPRGIRIIVSARYLAGDVDERGWLERLRWGAGLACNLPLPTLTRAGVSEVLAAMGNPLDHLATQVNVVGELFRLSQGDPLLVRLYVEALLPYSRKAAAIRPEDLPSILEGLAGYFERWWEDQRAQWEAQGRNELMEKEDVLRFLNVCASALGPLTREDIASLAGGNLTSGLRIKAVAADVARFVIGDGDRGYVFGHPRLGYFFWDQMTKQERSYWEEEFLNYGRRLLEALNAGRLAPDKAPAYALRYYGAHLERAKARPEALWELVSEGWLHAWYTLEGSYAGFLNDTERAWRAAENSSLWHGSEGTWGSTMAVQFRSTICHASVTALSVGIPVELLALAKEHGVLTSLQALVLARQIPDEKICADALAAIASGLPEWMQEDVLVTAQRFESEATRAWTLGQLAPHLSEGLRKVALESARSFLNPRARALALSELATYLPAEEGELALQEAFAAANGIDDERALSRTLSRLAARLSPDSVLVESLLSIAQGIKDPTSRARALTGLVSLLASPLREEILVRARSAAKEAADRYSRALLFAKLIPLIDESERPAVTSFVFRDIKSVGDIERATGVLALVAPYFPAHLLQEAVEWASGRSWKIPPRSDKQFEEHLRRHFFGGLELVREKLGLSVQTFRCLLQEKVWAPLDEANLELVREAVISLVRDQQRSEDPLLLSGERVVGLEYYDSIPGRLWFERPTIPVAPALELLLPYLSTSLREKVCSNVLNAVNAWDPDTQARVLAALAEHLPPQLSNKALGKLRSLDSTFEKVRALVRFLPRLPEREREPFAQSLIGMAAGLAGEYERVRALTDLARQPPGVLNEAKRKEILREALKAAQAINDRREAAQFAVNMAKALTGELQARAMEETLEQFSQIQDGEDLASLLHDLLPSVSESVAGRALEVIFSKCPLLDPEKETGFILTLLPRLQEPHSGKAVGVLLERLSTNHSDQGRRVWLAGELFAYLTPEQAMGILEAARINWSLDEYISVLVKSSRHLTGKAREACLRGVLERVQEVLSTTQGPNLLVQLVNAQPEEFQSVLAERLLSALDSPGTAQHPWERTNFLIRLLRHMSDASKERLVRSLFAGGDLLAPHHLVEMYRGMAHYIPEDLLPAAFEGAEAIFDTDLKARALAALVPYLAPELRGRALRGICDAISMFYKPQSIAKILSRIAHYMSEDERREFVSSVLSKNGRLSWGDLEVNTLRAVAPYLVGDNFADALSFAQSITDQPFRVEAYALLCPHLPEDLRDEALRKALADISKIDSWYSLDRAYTALGPCLPDETWKCRVLEEAQGTEGDALRASALSALAPFLPDKMKVEAMSKVFEIVMSIQERGQRDRALVSLAAHIPPDGGLLQDSVRVVLGLRHSERLQSLRALAPRLAVWAGTHREAARSLWGECMHGFSQHPRPVFFNEINELLPFMLALPLEEEKDNAILGLLRAGQDVTNWWP